MSSILDNYKDEIKKAVEKNDKTYRELGKQFGVSGTYLYWYYKNRIEPKGVDNSGKSQGESPW